MADRANGRAAHGLRVDGRSLHDAVSFALDLLEDPSELGDLAPPRQDLRFVEDDQYVAWMEVYLSRFADPPIERWLSARRPLFSRSAGGHPTLFFWHPPRHHREES